MTILGIILAFLVWALIIWLARTQITDPLTKKVVIIGATILLIILLLWAGGWLGWLYLPVRR